MKNYPIEINWQDVVAKLSMELQTAQKDAAMRYAMCEALKRLLDAEKNPQSPGSDGSK